MDIYTYKQTSILGLSGHAGLGISGDVYIHNTYTYTLCWTLDMRGNVYFDMHIIACISVDMCVHSCLWNT
jgi:hypothetical protein